MDFDNLNDLLKHIEKNVKESLEDDVAKEVKRVMKDHIETDVYDVYEPTSYKRTGKLKEDIDHSLIEDGYTLSVRNTREENQYGKHKNIAEIIETGIGYEKYKVSQGKIMKVSIKPSRKSGWKDWKPRPFTENTRLDLIRNKQHEDAMRKGLKKRGMEVE
jgi:hypothetical protein